MGKWSLPDIRSIDLRRIFRMLKYSFLEGWYMKGDPMSVDRGRLVMCNYTSNIIANLVGGTFWTGLLIYMNADDGFIGTMSMISTAANMLQCLSPLLLERFPKRRKLLTLMRAAMYFINVLLIGLIPLFPASRQVKLYMTGFGVLIVNIVNAFIAPGLNIWHMQSLPNNKVRRSYFSVVTMTVGAIVAICNLLGGWLVDMFAANGMQYAGLMTLRIIAAVLCVVEMFLYFRIKEYPYEGSGSDFTIKDLVTKPFREKIYLLTVAVTFLWYVTANIPGSYFTVYLLKNIDVTYSYITLISMVNVPMVLFLTPLWRKVLGRFGWFKTLYVAMGGYVLHYIALALVTKSTVWVYPISQIMGYACAVGINLSFTGVPYVNMPKQNQTVFIGFYSTAANLAALIGVTLGRFFITSAGEASVTLLGMAFTGKQMLMLITGGLMCIAVVGIRAISKRVNSSD